MVFDVKSLAQNGAAEKFDTYLDDFSYVGGYTPSQADVEAFSHFNSEPDVKHQNVHRWWKHISSFSSEEKASFPASEKKEEKKADDDDEIDLFGDGDDEEYEKELERRRKEAEEKRGGKKSKEVIAKSSVLFDVKPWDDTTDLKLMEEKVREIQMEGLLWGASKLVEVAFGVKKLTINAVIVDDLVSTEDIEEQITAHEDLVQSVDIAAFNKI